MLERTMTVEPKTKLFNSIIDCYEKGREWGLDGKKWDIVDAREIDNSTKIRIYLKEAV